MLLPFVFVRPVSRWLGQRSFFCFILAHLAFYPGGNTIGSHIEQVALGTLGSTLWLGLGYLVICGQVWLDEPNPIYSSARTRGLGASYLFVTFFIGGMIWSRVPRLRSMMRVGMFVQTWAMTGSTGIITATNFTQLFYPLIVTAVLSLLANMCFPRTGRDAYFQSACQGLKTCMQMVDVAVSNFDSELRLWVARDKTAHHSHGSIGHPPPPMQSAEFINLRKGLEGSVARMRRALAATSHEISWCRVPVSKTNDILEYMIDMGTWMSCGFGMDMPTLPFEQSSIRTQHHGDEEASSWNETNAEPPRREYGNPTEASSATEEAQQGTSLATDDELPSIAGHEKPLKQLYTHLQDALAAILVVIEVSYGCAPSSSRRGTLDLAQAMFHSTPHKRPRQILADRRDALQKSIDFSRFELHKLIRQRQRISEENRNCSNDDTQAHTTKHSRSRAGSQTNITLSEPSLFRSDMCALSFYALSLIEVSYRTVTLLENVSKTVDFYEKHPKPQLFFPVLNFKGWFFSSSGLGLFQDFSENSAVNANHLSHNDGPDANTNDADGDENEKQEGGANLTELFDDMKQTNKYRTYAMNAARASNYKPVEKHKPSRYAWITRFFNFLHLFSRNPSVLRARIYVSHFFRRIKRSRHIQFGLKLASGVVLLTIPAYLLPKSQSWWNKNHGQWMVISYIWCLEGSTGDSIWTSLCRIAGTISGAITGILAFEISRGNTYGLAVLVVLFEIPASVIRLHSRYPAVGTVMGVTTPIVALVSFFDENTESPGVVAITRGYMICIGIVAALMMNTFVWPYHARIKLGQKLSGLAGDLQVMYLNLTRHMFYVGFFATPQSQKQFTRVEHKIRSNVNKCYMLINVMNNELSLVPKPITVLTQILVRLECIFDLLVGLRMCREHGLQSLRQKVVWDVADLRQEMASAVLLNLWIIGQSLLTRSRLPQFLPSARRILDELTATLAYNHGEVFYDRDQDEVPVFEESRHFFDAPRLQYNIGHSANNSFASFQSHRPIVTMHLSRDMPPVPPRIGGQAPGTPSRSTDGVIYLLAEHMILSQLVASLEALLQLTRNLLGELQIVHADPVV